MTSGNWPSRRSRPRRSLWICPIILQKSRHKQRRQDSSARRMNWQRDTVLAPNRNFSTTRNHAKTCSGLILTTITSLTKPLVVTRRHHTATRRAGTSRNTEECQVRPRVLRHLLGLLLLMLCFAPRTRSTGYQCLDTADDWGITALRW